MNYRNLTINELTNYICNESNRNKFIEAAKELTTRVVNGDYVTIHQLEDAKESAFEKGEERGYKEGRDAARQEMVEYLEHQAGQWIDDKPLDKLLNIARTLG